MKNMVILVLSRIFFLLSLFLSILRSSDSSTFPLVLFHQVSLVLVYLCLSFLLRFYNLSVFLLYCCYCSTLCLLRVESGGIGIRTALIKQQIMKIHTYLDTIYFRIIENQRLQNCKLSARCQQSCRKQKQQIKLATGKNTLLAMVSQKRKPQEMLESIIKNNSDSYGDYPKSRSKTLPTFALSPIPLGKPTRSTNW